MDDFGEFNQCLGGCPLVLEFLPELINGYFHVLHYVGDGNQHECCLSSILLLVGIIGSRNCEMPLEDGGPWVPSGLVFASSCIRGVFMVGGFSWLALGRWPQTNALFYIFLNNQGV